MSEATQSNGADASIERIDEKKSERHSSEGTDLPNNVIYVHNGIGEPDTITVTCSSNEIVASKKCTLIYMLSQLAQFMETVLKCDDVWRVQIRN